MNFLSGYLSNKTKATTFYYVRVVRGGSCGSFGDADSDGICDDGDATGVVGDHPCTGGTTVFAMTTA